MGILIPKPLRIWTSLSHITLAICVRVRARAIGGAFPWLGRWGAPPPKPGKSALGTRLVLRVFPLSASGGRKNGNKEYFETIFIYV